MAGVTSPDTPHLTALLTERRDGSSAAGACAGAAGMPAVAVASSAYVREASVWPTRASN